MSTLPVQKRTTTSPYRVLEMDASLAMSRDRMIHGVRTDGDARLLRGATEAAQEQYVTFARLCSQGFACDAAILSLPFRQVL